MLRTYQDGGREETEAGPGLAQPGTAQQSRPGRDRTWRGREGWGSGVRVQLRFLPDIASRGDGVFSSIVINYPLPDIFKFHKKVFLKYFSDCQWRPWLPERERKRGMPAGRKGILIRPRLREYYS